MLIDELRVSVATKQDGEVVEPSDDALELDPIDQENGYGRLVLSHVIQEHVLNVLRLLVGHGDILLFLFEFVISFFAVERYPVLAKAQLAWHESWLAAV